MPSCITSAACVCACVRIWQARLAQQCAHADSLAARLAMVEGAAEGVKAAASASEALSKCQRELSELQAEYNRVSRGA